MRVSKILKQKVKYNHKVNKISINSKDVKKNDIFVAIKGNCHNGQDYIEEAIVNGARTIISEDKVENEKENINYIKVNDSRKALAIYANRFYKDISKKVKLVGITGTNGKTSVSTMVYKYLRFLNKNVTLIGTNGIYMNDEYKEISNTTPHILDILEIIKTGLKKKIKYVVMEVSSHAIKQYRIYGLKYDIALLTNITLDHLDFHKTFADYRYTKASFLASLNKGTVIINKDIPDYLYILKMCKARVKTYGKSYSDYMYHQEKCTVTGSKFLLNVNKNIYDINTNLLGKFNIYNILSFVAIVDGLKLFSKKTIEFLNNPIEISGRMEFIHYQGKTVVIDFAHTPDGILNVLTFLNSIKENKIILVLGCGGSRDKTKRKIMGEIGSQYSDFFYVTSDNPRWENNKTIMQEIEKGIVGDNYKLINNRYQAIKEALQNSEEKDIIAILGKGNEEFQIIKDEYIPFNDKEVVMKIIGGDSN